MEHYAGRWAIEVAFEDGNRTSKAVDEQPEAARALAAQCAWLPLALRVAAELAAGRPAAPLSDVVTELDEQLRRLDVLDVGGDPHAAVLTVLPT